MKGKAKILSISVLLALFVFAGMNIALAAQQDEGSLSEQDKTFMKEAASGGLMEVAMGEIAAKQAASGDVKTFGNRMVTDHSKANAELMQVAEKKGVTLPKEMEKKHKDMVDKLSKLQGAEFDRAYMNAMVEDHQEDVKKFQKEAKEGKDPDLKAFAAKIAPILEDHLKMAQSIQAKVK